MLGRDGGEKNPSTTRKAVEPASSFRVTGFGETRTGFFQDSPEFFQKRKDLLQKILGFFRITW
jgi:hypothetical protein